MYRGKHSPKRRSRWNKSAAMMVSLLLVFTMALGGTLAYIFTGTEDVQNTFTISKVTTAVEETIEGGVKKTVKIQNTGDTDAYIRATVVVTWQNDKGEVYGQKPVVGTNYTAWTPENDWLIGNDGFYYYSKPVAPHDKSVHPNDKCYTGVLIDSISPVGDSPAEGYHLTVEIIASGIQSKPAAAFDAWAENSGITYGATVLSKQGG